VPCYERRVFKNDLITSGSSVVDKKALEAGLDATGMKMEVSSTGALAIVDRETNRHLAYLSGNELRMESRVANSAEVEKNTMRIRQAYSVGVAVVQAAKNYWSPRVERVGENYVVKTTINY
jgi:hypothetical protein